MRVPTLAYTDADGDHTFELARASTSVGRSPGQDVLLRERFVSRQHAIIVNEDSAWTVVDRESTHGTFVNGTRVHRAVLNDGDVLQLGSLDGPRLRFRLSPADEDGPLPSDPTVTTLLSTFKGFTLLESEPRPAAREIEQLNWLLSAARQLNAGGAVPDVLTTLLQLTLQLTGAERGFVFLGEGGEMKLARGLSADGRIVEEDSTVSRRAMRRAIESESRFSVSDTLADENVAAWASVMANRIRSIYCIPLRKREAAGKTSQLLGLLYLDSQIGAGNLSEVDHQLLDTIAGGAASLVHNALLAEAEYKARQAREELAVAARIHSGLMAIALPVLPWAALQARSVPCLEIGGDFYDAVAVDGCVCVAIADVSGKGVSAAIVAATLQGIIHAQLLSGQGLPEIAALLNQFLCTRRVGKYATLVLLKLLSDGRLEYMNCGHVQPLLVRGGRITPLEEGNLIVGLLPGATYASAQIELERGDRILLVTDGLAEAENPAGEPFGDAGISGLADCADLDAILDRVAAFQAPNAAQDDCTLVEVRYLGGFGGES
jgi:serine phosphatase RsbU (regulator of sigma subunit)